MLLRLFRIKDYVFFSRVGRAMDDKSNGWYGCIKRDGGWLKKVFQPPEKAQFLDFWDSDSRIDLASTLTLANLLLVRFSSSDFTIGAKTVFPFPRADERDLRPCV